MAKSSTTWPAGQKPPTHRRKGTKNKKTILKEKLGLDGWAALEAYIDGKGADKAIREMKTLKGRNFILALTAVAEFVKPKLARSEHTGKGGKDLLAPPDLSNLSDEELDQYIRLTQKTAVK